MNLNFLRKAPPVDNAPHRISIRRGILADKYPPASPTNKIQTAKYTVWNFVFKNLFEQFRRVANFYFIIMLFLQTIPQISAWPATLGGLPLFIVLGVSAIKDAAEDWKRHRADSLQNNQVTHVLQNLTFLPTQWKNLSVGQIIKIKENEQIPADVLILASSNPDERCFVQTGNLDGETNLKPKYCVEALPSLKSEKDFEKLFFDVEAQPPVPHLYTFNGSVMIHPEGVESQSPDSKHFTLGHDNLLLRGCFLKNTEWVIALVLYTGKATKIVQNTGATPSKRTQIERSLNAQIILIFLIQLVVSGIFTTLSRFWIKEQIHHLPPSIGFGHTEDGEPKVFGYGASLWAFLNFWTFLLISQNLIPIALYASVEVIKASQAYFIAEDEEMYDPRTDSKCIPRSWNLSDDIGQVQYLFTDKTGTLTENIMKFKKCTINGVAYGKPPTGKSGRETWTDTVKLLSKRNFQNQYIAKEFDFDGVKLAEHLVGKEFEEAMGVTTLTNQEWSIRQFFTVICICHEVFVDSASSDNNTLIYSAQSPDETGLAEMAKNFGFVFLDRTPKTITCFIEGETKTFNILYEIPFESERKRMSVLVEFPEGDIFLLCKGADNVIFERALADEANNDVIGKTAVHLQEYAEEGLRTLCIASRKIERGQYQEWAERIEKASSMTSTEQEILLNQIHDEMEKDLRVLGGTAIEDKLQDGVPDTIAKLREAGIKVWMLTGDKLETAINIGQSCRLTTEKTHQMVIQGDTIESITTHIREAYRIAQENLAAHIENGLVIDGKALSFALQPEIALDFLELCCSCNSVICCRVSPQQKAMVVSLVKKNKKVVTMSIGDGANDVSMIQKAHVGVGILGLEGRQAAMASDFAISRFRFLQRLILVHGRWCYLRSSEMTLIFFFKNFVFVLPLFWFQFSSGYTSQMVYHFAYQMVYNLAYTSLPIMALSIFDQEVDDEFSLRFPQIFQIGIQKGRFNQNVFWLYILDGVWQSVMCYIIPFSIYGLTESSTLTEGWNSYLYQLGTVVATCVVLSANLTVAFQVRCWSWPILVGVLVSTLAFFIIHLVADLSGTTQSSFTWDFTYLGISLFRQPVYWLTVLVTVTVSLLPRIAYRSFISLFHPSDLEVIREKGVLGLVPRFTSTFTLASQESGLIGRSEGKSGIV